MLWFVPRPSGDALWWSMIALWSLIATVVAMVKYARASRKEDRS